MNNSRTPRLYWLLCLVAVARLPVGRRAGAGSRQRGAKRQRLRLLRPSQRLRQPHTPDLANPKVTSAQAAEFKPPFPERADLFEAPKGGPRARSGATMSTARSVELKGFVNVDEPQRRAFDRRQSSHPCPKAAKSMACRSFRSSRPKAVLQRGRSRWTATLE